MSQPRLFALLPLFLCLLGGSIPMWAQGDTGRVEGTVTDKSGAAVPNAAVTITNQGTGREIQVQSSESSGAFAVPGLPVGHYLISVQLSGFKKYTRELRLDPGQVAGTQIVLEPGQVNETVTVTDEAGLVDSASSDIATTFNSAQVGDLPLNGRDFTQLALLSPGVSRGVPTSSATGINGNAETFRYGGVGGAALSVNGLRPQANNFLLDGADNNESLVNSIVFFPPAEAINEFRVSTSVAPAEFGRAGGGIVNTSIKSGTNQIHGSAFDFLRNSQVDARQTFAPAKTLFQRNQFGGTLGAPVIKNKFFLFGDYQGLRQNQPLVPHYVTVPTAAMRNGDFSVLLNPALSGLSQPYVIHNVTTGQPYPGNVINTPLNSVGQAYLNAFPLPTLTSQVQQNYLASERQTQQFDDFDVRGDYIVSQKQSMFGRFSFGRDLSNTSSEFSNLPAGFGTGTNFNDPRGAVWSDTYAVSPSLVNQLWLSWQRDYLGYNPPFGNTPVSANLGIPNANRSPLLGGGALIGGYGSQLEYSGDYGLYAVPENTYEIKDGLTKIMGAHTFKFGTDLIRREVNYFRPEAGKGYFFLFGNGQGPGSTGYEASDVLAGFLSSYSLGAQSGYYGTRSWENGFFGQDDWRVNSRLTLNLGLRYDVLTWPTEQFNRQSAFDLANGTVLLAGQNGNSASLVKNDWNNFAPRVGFAYQLSSDGKTVLRGGYGMFYFVDRGGIDNQLGQNAPFAGVSAYNYSNGYRFTLAGQAPLNSNNPLATSATNFPAPGFTGFDPANPSNVSISTPLLNNRNSYVHEFNIQLQREVFKDAVFTLAYVGDLGRKLSFYYPANQQFFAQPSGAKPYPNLGNITVQANRGTSSYNSLQTQFEKRMSHGLQFRTAFTWSKNIDDGDGAFDGSQPQNPTDFAAERSVSSLDQRFLFTADFLADLPFGRGHAFGANWSRPLDAVLGGWHLNTIWTAQSGLPFNITAGSGNMGNERPNLVKPLTVSGNLNGYFDTTALVAPAQLGGNSGVYLAPGNLGRNALTGPGFFGVDVSVFKDFALTEKLKLQFRGEAYNIANTPRFAQPDGNFFDGNFGRITGTLLDTERQVEFAARLYF